VTSADDLLGEIRRLQDRAAGILDGAELSGDGRLALAAIREIRGIVELLAKMLGELDSAPNVSVELSTDWAVIRAALLVALGPYPEARVAVAETLVGLGA
jgi:hypothetical protein